MQSTQQPRDELNDTQQLTVKITDVQVEDEYRWIDLCDSLGLETIGSGLRHSPGHGGEASCSTYRTEDGSLVMEKITSIPADPDEHFDTTTVAFTGTHNAVDNACQTLFQLFDEAELDDENPIQYPT